MIYSHEIQFLANFIFESSNVSDTTTCHALIVRKLTLRIVPCEKVRPDDINIFRLMPVELKEGMTKDRFQSMTDRYITVKNQLALNNYGRKNGPTPKNTDN